MISLALIFLIFCTSPAINNTCALDSQRIVILILSQGNAFHVAHAELLKKDVERQAIDMGVTSVEVVLSHKLNINGSWTIGPLLPHLSKEYSESEWFFFCLENTVIRLRRLLHLFTTFNTSQNQWLSHALYDKDPTIIHHFAEQSKKFKYPNVASGFAITAPLLKSLAERVYKGEGPSGDFTIDVSYEFATFVFDEGRGVRLKHVPEFCVVSSEDCATYPRFFHPCSESISPENVFIAVKTCHKYHNDRIPVILRTWAKYASNIGFFTNEADKNLSNAYIVPNTDHGHCAKSHSILRIANDLMQKKSFDWLIISDDDTIFSFSRLLRLLTCYNPSEAIALGERYGFRVWNNNYLTGGYDYLTGGAGLALSATLVQRLVQPQICDCPSPSTPDDMYLFGACFPRVGVLPTHSPLFHQARPIDYATAYLASQEPISFHKFWMIDPDKVYEEWFAESDRSFFSKTAHIEL
ncbi:beta-1,3-glucosyltransferase [Orussus abietinus]|uniref:beta-1,3-glucosyltransferase n=1 Tax=Orussus abietinus TaxID=222816 RepID=UPI000625B083|nr:beta-1,3-glucosyltransferase [Orussus abietinus]